MGRCTYLTRELHARGAHVPDEICASYPNIAVCTLAAKAIKVKQAHEQAEKEVAAFKQQLEAQLQASMQQARYNHFKIRRKQHAACLTTG